MIIIGITGTLGAGKGTIVEYLISKGFHHYSAREFLISKLKERGLEINRDSMTQIANKLRKEFGPAYVIDKLYDNAVLQGENCVIESIRTIGEVEMLRKKDNFYLFAVDADQNLRYSRIKQRKSHTDDISFEKFVSDEEREMNSKDENSQNLRATIERADFVFQNNKSIEDLNIKIEEVLVKILKENNK